MKRLLYIGNKLSVHGNTPTAIEVLGPLLEREGFSVTYASSKKNKFPRIVEMLVKTIRHHNRVDFVLIDTYSTYNFWFAFLVSQLCRLFRIKYIPILHGGALPNRLKKSPGLCRMVFSKAHQNVAPSAYLLEKFTAAGFNVTYIPNPVDLNYFPFKKRGALYPKLLWVRSLTSIYNPDMALGVVKILKPVFPDATLCMVGPDKSNMLAGLKDSALKDNLSVIFPGRMEKEEWAIASEKYDIFINTSHIDNAPYSLIEAASLGLPIVSTNVGGIGYIFRDKETALLVDDGDAQG